MQFDDERPPGVVTTASDEGPGRRCPVGYRYSPNVFRTDAPPRLQALEVLYVVGGLYGNDLALERVLELFDRERGRKRLVFNGDFHWFDVDPAVFSRIQSGVLEHEALRGNVETELASDDSEDGAGCGCAYPDWVGQAVVDRSNRILRRLRQAAAAKQREELARLSPWQRADVGPLRLGLVHGDATSLAGWGFAQETLREAGHRRQARRWLDEAGVDAFACSHTCLPVFQALGRGSDGVPGWVLNNGAAGMPNFEADRAGLLTRVALSPFPGDGRRFGIVTGAGSVHVDAIAIEFDAEAWFGRFIRQWPEGSDAHRSYCERMTRGPAYRLQDAVRREV